MGDAAGAGVGAGGDAAGIGAGVGVNGASGGPTGPTGPIGPGTTFSGSGGVAPTVNNFPKSPTFAEFASMFGGGGGSKLGGMSSTGNLSMMKELLGGGAKMSFDKDSFSIKGETSSLGDLEGLLSQDSEQELPGFDFNSYMRGWI